MLDIGRYGLVRTSAGDQNVVRSNPTWDYIFRVPGIGSEDQHLHKYSFVAAECSLWSQMIAVIPVATGGGAKF